MPAPRVHDHRHAPLVGEREDRLGLGLLEPEPLGARMELDPARAAVEAALGLATRVAVGVEPAERHEQPAGALRLREHAIVRAADSRPARAS